MHLPAVRTLFFYGIGLAIVFGVNEGALSVSWKAFIPWLVVLWISIGLASFVFYSYPRLNTALFMLFITTSGVICAASQEAIREGQNERFQILDIVDKASILVEGKVMRLEKRFSTTESEWVVWASVHSVDSVTFVTPVKGRFVQRLPQSGSEMEIHTWLDAQEGDEVTFRSEISNRPSPRVPGVFHYPSWLKKERVMLTGSITGQVSFLDNKEAVEQKTPWIVRVRDSIRSSIDRKFDSNASEFVHAFILGDRSQMENEQKQAFSNSGLSHIMAVSGLHVGLLIAPFWALFPLVAPKKRLAVLLWLLIMGILWSYCALTGWSVSVQRASLMTLIMATTRCFMMQRIAVQTLSVAALLLLLKNPEEVFEAGFQLSFGAAFGLLTWMQTIQGAMVRTIPWAPLRWVLQVMSVSVVAQCINLPILASWFGAVSWISPIANLLVIPFLGIAMPATILTLLTPDVFLQWIPVHELLSFFFTYILKVSSTFGSPEWTINTQAWPLWALVCWAIAMITLRPQASPFTRWRGIMAVCLILSLVGVSKAIEKTKPASLHIWMLDVGQGDSFVVQTPSKQSYIIDTGVGGWGLDSAERVILPFLAYQEIDHLDGLILTHSHADHIGGAKTILQSIPVDTVFVARSFANASSKMVKNLLAEIDHSNQPLRTLAAGELFWMGACCPSLVVAPFFNSSDPHTHGLSRQQNDFTGNLNNQSLVFKTLLGKHSILWTGDAEIQSEQNQLQWATPILPSTILKTGHHGSRTSTSLPYLEAVRPSIAMTTVGLLNRYRLPNREVAKRLDSLNVTHLATSLHGTVHLQTDGQKIRILLE